MRLFTPSRIKVHSLTGRITLKLAKTAFKAVKANRGAAGVDRVSVDAFEANLVQNLESLVRTLKDGSYQSFPLRRHFIDKGGGKLRPLGIPAVRDRVAQEIVLQLLSPIFEPKFHPASYGFRPGRNCHMAIEQALDTHEQGLEFVLDADIQGFFDNLPHNVIMQAVAAEVADGNILRLIEKFLSAGVMVDGVFQPTHLGTPQGGVISPLLANIVLNHMDWHMDKLGYRLVRYADDFVIITQTYAQAKEAWKEVEHVLKTLGLALSQEKTKIRTYRGGYAFLGFVISRRSRRMRDKSVQKLREKIKELTHRSHNFDAQVVEQLNRVIQGTANYFAPSWSTTGKQFRALDSWMRMRVRAMWIKRKRATNNYRVPTKWLTARGLLSLSQFIRPKVVVQT